MLIELYKALSKITHTKLYLEMRNLLKRIIVAIAAASLLLVVHDLTPSFHTIKTCWINWIMGYLFFPSHQKAMKKEEHCWKQRIFSNRLPDPGRIAPVIWTKLTKVLSMTPAQLDLETNSQEQRKSKRDEKALHFISLSKNQGQNLRNWSSDSLTTKKKDIF